MSTDSSSPSPTPAITPQSIEARQVQSRQRILGGAAVVVGIGLWFVYSFPALFRVPLIFALLVFGVSNLRKGFADEIEQMRPKTARGVRATRTLGIIALVLFLLQLPNWGFASNSEGPLPLRTMVLMGVYALFALGLNIVVGFAGLLDLGYVAFFLFGAYTAAWLMSDFGYQVSTREGAPKHQFSFDIHFLSSAANSIQGIHISFWLVIIVAATVAALAGLVIGAPTLRLKSDYLALVTLGFGEILPEVFRNSDNIGGVNFTNGASGIGPVDAVSTGYAHNLPKLPLIGKIPQNILPADDKIRLYIIIVICALFVYASLKLRDGRLGRAWMAIREDELAASLMGVPLMRTKLWSYAVGAIAGGIGGAFFATIVGTVTVDTFEFSFSIIILCAVILGGMGNVWGAISGAIVITWFDRTGLDYIAGRVDDTFKVHFDLKSYQFGLFGLVLVLMMLFRPQGLIPATRARQVRKADQQVLEHEHLGFGLEVGAIEDLPNPRPRNLPDEFEVPAP